MWRIRGNDRGGCGPGRGRDGCGGGGRRRGGGDRSRPELTGRGDARCGAGGGPVAGRVDERDGRAAGTDAAGHLCGVHRTGGG
ncbi:hypothetical protein FKW78_26690 [Mycolicibacterium fortuitum]|nr:hypothetical protein FKW78_26690 [Mycolicibacterium fortuitum]